MQFEISDILQNVRSFYFEARSDDRHFLHLVFILCLSVTKDIIFKIRACSHEHTEKVESQDDKK